MNITSKIYQIYKIPPKVRLSTIMTDLDFPDLVGLELRCAVVMNDSNSTHELQDTAENEIEKQSQLCWIIYIVSVSVTYSHSDGHGGLCDCVHGRRNEWRLQGYLPGQSRGQILTS